MATIYKSKYTGEQIELLLGDVETLKGVNLGQQTSGTPFTIDEATKQILFGETPPIITVQIDNTTVNLYRIAINSEKAYYTNTIETDGTTYFITIVVNSNLQCEIKSTRELVIPQPTQENAGKILKVNAVGNGFELVEIEDAITFATETQVDRLFNGLLGTWYFHPKLSLYYLTAGTKYNISFTSNTKNYVAIKSEAYGPSTRYRSLKYVDSDGTETVVYKSETTASWVDEGYKSVTITETSLTETEYNSVRNFFTNSTLPPIEHKPISIDNLEQFKQKCDETYAPIGDGGTTVVANPTLSGSEAELIGLEVAGTKYKVPSGGGGGTQLYRYRIDINALSSSDLSTLLLDVGITYIEFVSNRKDITSFSTLSTADKFLSIVRLSDGSTYNGTLETYKNFVVGAGLYIKAEFLSTDGTIKNEVQYAEDITWDGGAEITPL